MLAWIRRIIVSLGIGGASYLIMLAFMILSVVYDKELEPGFRDWRAPRQHQSRLWSMRSRRARRLSLPRPMMQRARSCGRTNFRLVVMRACRPTPFFDDFTKAPLSVPHVLTRSERAGL